MSETETHPGYHILGLREEGFKRIKLIDITPKGHLIKITGKNEQGKSSLLDGIAAALDGGAEFLQTVPIQVGRDKSVLRVTIGTPDGKVEMIVTKTIRRRDDGHSVTLVVENADGFRAQSPQKMLDTYLGAMTFDPLKFTRMKPQDQFSEISRLIEGVDFDDITAKNASDFTRRTEINRDAKKARAAAELIDVPDSIDAETQPVDEAALTQELAGAGRLNATIETRKERRAKVQQEIDDGPVRLKAIEDSANALIASSQERLAADVKQIDEEITRLQAKQVALSTEAENHQNKIAAEAVTGQSSYRQYLASQQETLDGAEPLPEPIDTEALTVRLTEARATNAAIRLRDQRQGQEDEAKRLEGLSVALTERIDSRNKAKEEAIAAAKLPVPGLGLGDGVVTLDGLPFAQASHARKLKTSAAIAMAMNTKLRVMLIKEAAFLDEDNLALLGEMAMENNYQILVELVDNSGKVGFVIEDGHIAGEEPPEAEDVKPKAARGKGKPSKGGELL